MPTESIFLLGSDSKIEQVPYHAYSSEGVLQDLIARYPNLLAGEQIDPDDPPRWLLVSREAGVPDSDSASDRWSADHLLLDHRGVPTLVEVKRSSDTRIRREVVGQMLEYAANATRYWPTDRIRTLAAERLGGTEQLDREVRALVDPASDDQSLLDVEAFWKSVDDNLRGGSVRLLFVADELPGELRRVIEFLNEHMPKVEVLGVEVRQYEGHNVRALVPRVVGQTERIRQERAMSGQRRRTSEAEFLKFCPDWARPFFQDLFLAADERSLTVAWGTKGFSLRVRRTTGEIHTLLYGYPPGALGRDVPFLEFFLKHFSDAEGAEALRRALIQLGGFREGGNYTISLELTQGTLASAKAAMPHLWEASGRLSGSAA